MPDLRIAVNDAPRTPPPGKEPPIGDPPRQDEPPKEAPPATDPNQPAEEPPEAPREKPGAAERIQKIRLAVRAVWWSAAVLTLVLASLALWMGFGRRDPFALVFVVLAGLCAVAGYGAAVAVRLR